MGWTDARARAALRAIFDASVAAADPRIVLAAHLPPKPTAGRCIVVGAGKSAAVMAAALEAAWPDVPLTGVVVTRYGHAVPTQLRVWADEGYHAARRKTPQTFSMNHGTRWWGELQAVSSNQVSLARSCCRAR